MASLFERMRQKPETVRVRYLFFSVGISFVCVVALWAFSLQASFGTLLKNDASDAVDVLRENAQTIQESAPVSLEDLLKAGKILKENATQSPSEATRSSTPETPDFLPRKGMMPEEGGDMPQAPLGEERSGALPGAGSDATKPLETPSVEAGQ